VEKWESVNDAVRQILGMDDSQFRKIAMLAQGEFRAFLSAKTDEREGILSLLFDDRQYRVFQEGMRNASRALEEERRQDRERISEALGTLEADQDLVGTLAAQVVCEAIKRAVYSARSAYGFPAAADL
jgi:exonuclease SbcC